MRKIIIILMGILLLTISLPHLIEAKSHDLKVITVNHEQEVDGIKMYVPELVLRKDGLALYVEASEKGGRNDGQYLRAGNIEFRITDEKGKEITSYSGEVTGVHHIGKWVYSSEKRFDPVNDNIKELSITPFLMLPTDGGGVEFDKDGIEKDINFEYSKLKDVEFESFTVKIPSED